MLPSELTWTFAGAVTVKLPDAGDRFEPDMLKLVDEPGVPDGVEGKVVVPPGTVMLGVKTVKVVDAPEAGASFPALSTAVFAAIEMPSVPLPVIPEIVTV